MREGLVISKDSNSSEILRWDMGVMFAKSYVTQLSDNVRRSQDQKLLNGEWLSKAPFGYTNIRRGRDES
jgi:site-specific DNA recombinase